MLDLAVNILPSKNRRFLPEKFFLEVHFERAIGLNIDRKGRSRPAALLGGSRRAQAH